MSDKGANSSSIIGIFIVVIILIVIFYSVNSGALNLGKSSAKIPTTFSVSAVSNASQLYSGKSTPLYVTLFNPFNYSFNANLYVFTTPPVSISPLSKAISAPANMKAVSNILFNVSCSGSSGSVIPYFAFEPQNIWQNITTSVVTYPYGTKTNLIPQTVYSNPNEGFMVLSANPAIVETQIPSGPLSTEINFTPTASYNSGVYTLGSPYTSLSNGNPNGYITQIKFYISNSTGGIQSAFVYYDGQNYPFSVYGNTLKLTLNDVDLALITSGSDLPIEITTTNDNVSSQNIINIDTNYNYYITFDSNQISCI